MHAWLRNDKLRSALLTLCAGLIVGGIVTYAAGLGSSEPKLAASDASVAAAIAGDQAKPTAAHATLTAELPISIKAKKAKPKVKRVAVKRSKRKAKRAPAAGKSAPEATATPDSDTTAEEKTSAATPVAAAPRPTKRVVARNRTRVTPQKQATPKSTPAPTPTPSKPAPAVSTPAPTPAPTSTPARPSPPRPNPHGTATATATAATTIPAPTVSARGPGRVNLIGEHTDYNGGLALPFAIDRGITATAEPLDGDRFELVAEDLGEDDAFPLADPGRTEGWRAFARGIVAELTASGVELVPARVSFSGDVPRGAGLSSSAALETALCLALLGVAGAEEPDRLELAKLCSRVENDWVGAETGLLDQIASLLGEEGRALRIDFATLAIEPVPFDLRGWQLATVDSGAAHDHAASGYNERRAECEAAARELGVEHLSAADPAAAERLPGPGRRRARHVLSENGRVDATIEALRDGDLEAVGRLLDASHASLRDDYEASVPDVEATVERLKAAGAAGARMMGGGFGGAVLSLFPPGAALPDGATVVAPGPPAHLL